jgi:hypothetical protein
MNFDISHLLDHWDYQPGQVVVRKFVGKDGVEKIQLRLDLGLLQMNAHGRPDGKRPFGHASLLDYFMARQKQFSGAGDKDEEFTLKAEECGRLQLEALQYHHRCVCLLQLEEYPSVIRDTTRNLKLFDFAAEYAATDEMAWSLEQFRPQTLLIHARARATQLLVANDFNAAIVEIETALNDMREFYRAHSRPDLLEQSGEIQTLEHWLGEVKSKKPLSKREKLELDLLEAVKREDYEEAARVRDALKNLRKTEAES